MCFPDSVAKVGGTPAPGTPGSKVDPNQPSKDQLAVQSPDAADALLRAKLAENVLTLRRGGQGRAGSFLTQRNTLLGGG